MSECESVCEISLRISHHKWAFPNTGSVSLMFEFLKMFINTKTNTAASC